MVRITHVEGVQRRLHIQALKIEIDYCKSRPDSQRFIHWINHLKNSLKKLEDSP